ncbi:MAG TPA: TIGR04283 family arsenosugar biosynthesis glycosyltransferase [Armatimonadota bacterium]|nr:TIGR04283 family arsenosugar biosynthesis glycosyltransferase [Armatimonadota bacterium]
MKLSIIVPVLNEATLVAAFLVHLREQAPGAQVVVADGGSTDGTREAVRAAMERWTGNRSLVLVPSARGRARQMNAGATAATGDILWFLHVDSRLPPGAVESMRRALEDPGLAGGCFRIRIPRPQLVYRVSDSLGNLGVDVFRIALGDHGIFCRRDAFLGLGGYPQVALMEDAELYRRLQRRGRVRQLAPAIETSPRRYELHGPCRTTILYCLILGLYVLRVPIPVLARIYARLR